MEVSRGPEGGQNLLLKSLDPAALLVVTPHLVRRDVVAGQIFDGIADESDDLFFPETAIISFRSPNGGGPEIALVGFEGVVGWPLLLRSAGDTTHGVVLMRAGSGLAITAGRFAELCEESPTLRASLLRFVHNLMLQMTSNIAATSDSVERRLARWLLMVHDRADRNALELTHDYIAGALDVRRASITDGLHLIEGEGLVRCTRGRVVIRDRARLRALAGASYGAVERSYSDRIAAFGAPD